MFLEFRFMHFLMQIMALGTAHPVRFAYEQFAFLAYPCFAMTAFCIGKYVFSSENLKIIIPNYHLFIFFH